MTLTEEQQAIVDHLDGTVLVLAAVGTGKTTALTHRLCRAVERGVPPERILALTFTNRAARNMRDHVERTAPAEARLAQVRTFHSLCAWILRSEAEHIGIPADFSIYDEDDTDTLIHELGVEEGADKLRYRMHAELSSAPAAEVSAEAYFTGTFSKSSVVRRYVAELTSRGAIDFSGLVYLARAVLTGSEESRARWSRMFDHVSVDELQDTHRSEYEILKAIAGDARSVCFIGDLDQTIYGWRGSDPQNILESIQSDFAPVTLYAMTTNFRSTKALVRLADRFAQTFRDRLTSVKPHDSLPEGAEVTVTECQTDLDEYAEVARACDRLIVSGTRPEDVAVLVRSNVLANELAQAFATEGIPHTTTEQLRFFRRNEVKDVLALMRLSVNRGSETAARRAIFTFWPELRDTAKQAIQRGGPIGARVSDLLAPEVIRSGDPLAGLSGDSIVILDTETTGLNPSRDEVIEVAAVRIESGREVGSFHRYARPSRPVGISEGIHHLSDDFLAHEGDDPAQVFHELREFVGETPIAGHNVEFDRKILLSHARRVGVTLMLRVAFDTMDVARRFYRSTSYRLEDLAPALGIPVPESHRAMGDVMTTAALADVLRGQAAPGAEARREFVDTFGPALGSVREVLDRFVTFGRPADLLDGVAEEPAVRKRFEGDDEAQRSIERLRGYLRSADDGQTPVRAAVFHLIENAALMKDADLLDDMSGVRILTVHQAKGLEFEIVFVPGMVQNGFPTYFALREMNKGDESRLEEEKRVFYVAITRPTRELHLSYHLREVERGRACQPSAFLPDRR